MMKENQKGYKAQGRVNKKDPYKISKQKEMDQFLQGISSESGPYQLDKMFKENQKGYKPSKGVHKKRKKYNKKKKTSVGGGLFNMFF